MALDLRMSLYSSHVGFGLGNCSHSFFNFFRSDSKKALELISYNLATCLPKAKPAPAKASAGGDEHLTLPKRGSVQGKPGSPLP